MALKIFVENLEDVPEVLRDSYVKRGTTYQLNLSDLESHVESQLKLLKSDLEITRAHERKLLVENGLGSALQRANIRPEYADLIIEKLDGRVALETVDNKRVVRIAEANGEMPLIGSGEGGVATLDDLVKRTAERFPSAFGVGETPTSAAKDTGGSGPKTMTKAAFDALRPIERAKKMNDGFTIVSAPVLKPQTRKLGPKEMMRSAFDALSPKERAAKMNEGCTLVD